MHSCVLYLSQKFPTNEDIGSALDPYYFLTNAAGEEVPFTFDWWQLGGRYSGKLKLRFDRDKESEYEWGFFAREPRAGRLFRSAIIEEVIGVRGSPFYREEDLFSSMGARDGYLYVDGAKIADCLNFDEQCVLCCIVLCDDGTVIVRNDDKFDDEVRTLCATKKYAYATFIDIHD